MSRHVKARTMSVRYVFMLCLLLVASKSSGAYTHLVCTLHGAVAAIHTLRLDVASKDVDLLHTCRFFRLLTPLHFLQRNMTTWLLRKRSKSSVVGSHVGQCCKVSGSGTGAKQHIWTSWKKHLGILCFALDHADGFPFRVCEHARYRLAECQRRVLIIPTTYPLHAHDDPEHLPNKLACAVISVQSTQHTTAQHWRALVRRPDSPLALGNLRDPCCQHRSAVDGHLVHVRPGVDRRLSRLACLLGAGVFSERFAVGCCLHAGLALNL